MVLLIAGNYIGENFSYYSKTFSLYGIDTSIKTQHKQWNPTDGHPWNVTIYNNGLGLALYIDIDFSNMPHPYYSINNP